jgi:ketosteroid isomerase-like protein
MRRILTVVVLSLIVAARAPAAAQTPASSRAEVLAAVRQFVDGFNKGDVKMLTASCAEQVSIIDEFPPHEWHGPGACATWANAYDADAKKNGITDGVVTLGTPAHVDINGDRAYVVGSANYSYKQRGKPVKEVGSTFTLSLQKLAAGWRITGWAWAKR